MKQLLIVAMALCLFTSCKDNKTTDRRDREYDNRDRDDYNPDDRNNRDRDRPTNDRDYNDDRTNNDDRPYNDDRTNNDNNYPQQDNNYPPQDNNNGGGWSQANVREFVSNCVTSAVDGGRGMQRSTAQSYCDCMQRHVERLYPNPEDAGRLSDADLATPAMKRKIQECLGQ